MSDESASQDRYLLFSLGGELYGTPLLDVREVIEQQKIKAIPHTVAAFLGVVNIRGQIVGVVDLRLRLGYENQTARNRAMMVFSTPAGAIAAIVDAMEGVARIPEEKVERQPRVDARVPLAFLKGIGQYKGQLVTIIDFNGLFASEEFVSLSSVTAA